MRHLHLIPAGTKLDFISKKIAFFAFSICLLIASISIFGVNGLNYGIDFKGGIMMEVRSNTGPADISALRSQLSDLGLGEISIQEFGEPEEVLIRIQRQDGDEKAQQAAVQAVKSQLKETVEYRRTEFVGPKVSEELFMDGMMAVTLALGAILIYIWFRFEWQFGMGAVIALIHDIISTIGIFALLGMNSTCPQSPLF
jgi:preprotein translocase subunit SecF